MDNFLLIFSYEVKKIIRRRIFVIGFGIALLATLWINSQSIIEYSIGEHGAALYNSRDEYQEGGRYDYSALLHGIPFYYVDDAGELHMEMVNPFQYIRGQKQYALKWSGKKLDDETIVAMRDFIAQYDWVDSQYAHRGSFIQNYRWVFNTILKTGLNPESENLTEEVYDEEMVMSMSELCDNLQLTEAERDYWVKQYHMDYPITLSYTAAFEQIIAMSRYINLILVFFIIIASCGIFAEDRQRRIRSIILSTSKGHAPYILIKLAAGIAVSMLTGVILYGITFVIQFSLFGMDGFWAPIQLLEGLGRSCLMISAGPAVLLISGTGILIACMVSAVTLFCSEIAQNAIAAMAGPCAFLIYSLMFDHGIFGYIFSQAKLWQYFPLQRLTTLLYDARMVSFAGRVYPTIPVSISIYLLIGLLGMSLCAITAYARRRDK